ncbi:hypothetical protein BD309DRAFT_953848 [Dichomitus squalens]|nr:hypothetical protein BD309DRAFT_953848 [Dichomitus squalens]
MCRFQVSSVCGVRPIGCIPRCIRHASVPHRRCILLLLDASVCRWDASVYRGMDASIRR